MPDRSTASERAGTVVVGSGFGGSVSAYRLAEAGHDVVLLERGRPWPPGSFPRSPQEITDKLYWDPSRGKYGIFNVWSFRRLESLVSAGLGGGSLIYASVLLRKDPDSFVREAGEWWPVGYDDLEPHYEAVEAMLAPQQYPLDQPGYAVPKVVAFHEAAGRTGHTPFLPNLAVTFAAGGAGTPAVRGEPFGGTANLHGAHRRTCVLCGECDAGCNEGAKNTLDYTYLSTAAVGRNVSIRTSSEVTRFAPRPEGGFEVHYVDHGDGRRPRALTCDRLILAAGSIGTTFLLLKNRSAFPALGAAVGTRFCGNGDLLGFVTRSPRFLDPSSGPVITTSIRVAGPGGRDHYVQDAGYPEFLNWAWQVQPGPALVGRVLRMAGERLFGRRRSDMTGALGVLLGEQKSGRLMPLLGMGRDVPDGTFRLDNGELELDWTMGSSMAYFTALRRTMKELAGALGARYRDNPLWWFRRVITDHPVGGCPMGDDPSASVVDQWGEAWHYPGLYVLDGAALPGPVGANPSLTIAAFADRAALHLMGSV